MPRSSSELETARYLKCLFLAGPKWGKTFTIAKTCEGAEDGSVYFIDSDGHNALDSALVSGGKFQWDYCSGENATDIEKYIAEAREGVAAGRYKTIVWDTVRSYCERNVQYWASVPVNNTVGNTMQYSRPFNAHVMGIIDRLLALPCHVIVASHHDYYTSAEMPGQLKKQGEGIVAGLPGQLRISVGKAFPYVVMGQNQEDGTRVISTRAKGMWGLGLRGVGESKVDLVAPSIKKLWKFIQDGGKVPAPKEK